MSDALDRAFNLTICIPEGISTEFVEDITKWIKKATQLYHVTMESKDCLHACLFYKDSKKRKNIKDVVWRKVKEYYPDAVGEDAIGCHALPGRKWIDEYLLRKDTMDTIESTIIDNMDGLNEYFPIEKTKVSAKRKSSMQELDTGIKKQKMVCSNPFPDSTTPLSKWQLDLLNVKETGVHVVVDNDAKYKTSRVDFMKNMHRSGWGCLVPEDCTSKDDIFKYILLRPISSTYVFSHSESIKTGTSLCCAIKKLHDGVIYTRSIPERTELLWDVKVIVFADKITDRRGIVNDWKVWKVIDGGLVPYTKWIDGDVETANDTVEDPYDPLVDLDKDGYCEEQESDDEE